MTVSQLLERLTQLKHREVIWGKVADFLHGFLSQDIGEPQKMTADDCLIPNVPEKEIEAVLEDAVYPMIETIEQEVIDLGQLKVGHEKPAKKKPRKSARTRKKKSNSDDDG